MTALERLKAAYTAMYKKGLITEEKFNELMMEVGK